MSTLTWTDLSGTRYYEESPSGGFESGGCLELLVFYFLHDTFLALYHTLYGLGWTIELHVFAFSVPPRRA